MLKTLIKKELYKFFKTLTTFRGKGNRNDSRGGNILMLCIWGLVYFSMVMAFIGVNDALAGVLLIPGMNLEWVFFAINGTMGFSVCVLLSMFMVSSVLFNAKDNELLGSMPIPASYILISRMSSLYIQNVIYCSVAIVAAEFSCYVQTVDTLSTIFSPMNFVLCVLSLFPLALAALSLACVFGWLISTISKKIPNKSFVTMVLSIAFLGVYYYINFNMNKYVMILANNSLGIGESIKGSIIAWPLLQFGLACTGKVLPFICFCIFAVVVFAVVCFVISRNYRKISTATASGKKKVFTKVDAGNVKEASAYQALCSKEFKRFLASPVYMLNCGLGVILVLIGSVVAVIKADALKLQLAGIAQMFAGLGDDFIYMLLLAGVCFTASMNCITAPSISLEGNNIWILQSAPINFYEVFRAKRSLQIKMTLAPSLIFYFALIFAGGLDITHELVPLSFIVLIIYSFTDANVGLVVNLFAPKLDWTNEGVAVKQSLSVLIMIFVPWIFIGLLAFGYYLAADKISAAAFLSGIIVLMAVAYKLSDNWLRKRGTEVFAKL